MPILTAGDTIRTPLVARRQKVLKLHKFFSKDRGCFLVAHSFGVDVSVQWGWGFRFPFFLF